MRKFLSAVLVNCVIVFSTHAFAEDADRVFASKMQVGISLADSKRYPEALTVFDSLRLSETDSHKIYLALFFGCKTLERMKQYDRARTLLKNYQREVPADMRDDFAVLGDEIEAFALALN